MNKNQKHIILHFLKKKGGKTLASLTGKVLENYVMGGYQSGQLGRTVNPLTYVFAGSNPAPPTLAKKIVEAGVAQLVERQPSKL